MPIVDFGRIDSDASQEDILDAIAKIQKGIDYLMQGGLDSKNAREFGGWLVGNTELQSINKTVGMSTEDTAADDIRFWAGDLKLGAPKYKVTKSGILYAVDGNFKGHIDAESGTIGGFEITLTKLSGAGIIEGGTIRTAAPGNKRIELTGGTLKGYYADNQLHGLVFNPNAPTNFFDMFLYHDGVQLLEFYDEGSSIKLRPGSGTSFWSLGKSGGTTYLDGQWIFNPTASLNLGPNTATGRVQYANQADSALSSSVSNSVDWSNVTNHPDSVTLPIMNGSAAIGSSGKYAYSDHVHPSDTTRASTASLNLKANIAQEAWTAPTLQNLWVNIGAPYEPAGYYKDSIGLVHLRGTIKSGSTTAGAVVLTLPAGYRPANRKMFSTISGGATVTTSRLDMDNAGNLSIDTVGGNGFLSLDNITPFRAEL